MKQNRFEQNSILNRTYKALTASLLVAFAGISNINAAPLDLSDVPIFLQGSAPPAIALSFDTSSKTKKATVFYVEGVDDANLPNDKKYIAAPLINKMYYNPNVTYLPPKDVDGVDYPNSSFSGAWVDGYLHSKGIENLGTQYKVIHSYSQTNGGQCYDDGTNPCNGTGQRAYYWKYIGPTGFETIVVDGVNVVISHPNADDIDDDTNFVKITIPTGARPQDVQNDPDYTITTHENNFANWFSYYKSRNMLIKSSVSRAFGNLDPGFKLAWQTFKKNEGFETEMLPLEGQHKQDFWDWLLGMDTSGGDFVTNSLLRAGELFEQPQTYMEDGVGDLLSCQQNFHVVLTNSYANGGGTIPINVLDENDITLPDGTDYSPVDEALIYKYSNSNLKTFADIAFRYWAKDLMPGLDNDVPRYLSDFTNANGDQVQLGVGQEPWDTSSTAGNAIYWNPNNNPANWQHMVNFIIGMGIEGTLEAPQFENPNAANDFPNLRAGTPNIRQIETDNQGRVTLLPQTTGWSELGGNDEDETIDDMWHAAINSRGGFFSAKNPNQLTEAFLALTEMLNTRRTGSNSINTVSGNIVTEDTKIYKTSFDALDWSGSVVAQSIELDGSLGGIEWDAACLLTGGPCGVLGGDNVTATRTHETRKIYAFDKATETLPEFKESSLTTAQKAVLNQSELVQNNEATLTQLIDYLRGNQELELINGGVFRSRRVILGDVIHSSATVMRGPGEVYRDEKWPSNANMVTDGNSYQQFREDHSDRQNIILVGANDGMLHAFDAVSGDELWAYIPSLALENMHLLADPLYEHQNYVDGTPTLRDVYINGSWKTVAIGSLHLGGQGYYAIDVTDPLQPKPMWEFTDDPTGNKGNVDMGYSYGSPFVTRLRDDRWVALLPNGYNNVIPDGNVGSGTSVMFMVDISDGTMIQKFDTGEGDFARTNGMAGAVASDVPYDQTANVAFFGDLRGDVYRLELDNGTNFAMEKFVESPMAYETPITTPLRLSLIDNGSDNPLDVLVHIGTGKFIENIDRSYIPPVNQYVAGIFDRGRGSSDYPISMNDSRIVEQTIVTETNGQRKISDTEVQRGVDFGWKMELPNEGERIVARMTKRASAYFLIYASYLPLGGDACATGGSSWVSIVNSRTGGAPRNGSVLADGNADGILVENQVFGVTPIGFAGGGTEMLLLSTDTNEACVGENCTDETITIPDFSWRRRSWHRMFQAD